MGMSRRDALLGFGATAASGLAMSGAANACATFQASMICQQSGVHFAGIRPNEFDLISGQQTMVWCWAATLEMIFGWHGRNISQASIVTQVYGAPINAPIKRLPLLKAIERTFTDDDGDDFDVTSQVYDLYTGQLSIGNDDILKEFKARRPVIYCNATHMVAALGARYSNHGTPYSPNVTICEVLVADPLPPYIGSFRSLSVCEMVPAAFPGGQLSFVATVDVS